MPATGGSSSSRSWARRSSKRGTGPRSRAASNARARCSTASALEASATMFEDWQAIESLLMTHAEHVDSGRLAEAAAMFENATYRIERAGQPDFVKCRGAAQVEKLFAVTRLYPDGTPRTKHVVTNVNIELDGDRAR